MPAHKVILGVPFYGRSFQMDLAAMKQLPNSESTYGIKVLGGGEPGKFSREKGYLAYYEICQDLKGSHWTKRRDAHSGPYAFSDTQWVGYDDPTALLDKTKFIKTNHLGGAMTWAIDLDDFRGLCCGVKYPLLKTLNHGLRGMRINVRSMGCI